MGQAQIKWPEKMIHDESGLPLIATDQLEGGYWQVADSTARDAIPIAKRRRGMMITWIDVTGFVTKRFEGADTLTATWITNSNWVSVSGDMLKLIYDIDNDSIVDKADTATTLQGVDTTYLLSRTNHTGLDSTNDVVGFNDTTKSVIGWQDDGTVVRLTSATDSVGIGIGTPNRKLEVLDVSNPQLRLTSADGTQFTDFQTTSGGRLYINPSSALVGINTATPDAALDILDASSPQLRLTRVDPGTTTEFQTNAIGHLIITPSGNKVSLNSSTNAETALHLFGVQPFIRLSDNDAGSDLAAQGLIEFYRGAATSDLGRIGFDSTTTENLSILNKTSGGNINFRTGGSIPTTRMVINSGGNIGIGTISPNQKLTIEGTIDLKEQASANADVAGYGQLWVKTVTPNQLWFTDDTGIDAQVGILQTDTLAITSGQVLTLNEFPIEIIAAPGSGRAIEIISVSVKLNFNTTAYTTNTTLALITNTASFRQMDIASVLDATVSTIKRGNVVTGGGTTDIVLVDDQGVNVIVNAGNPAAGDSSIDVYVLYRIITL